MKFLSNAMSRLSLLSALTVAVLSAGCAGTVVVDYAIEAHVSGRDGNGREWSASPQDVVTIPRPYSLASPFAAQQYRGLGFEWTFGTGTEGFGGDITNQGRGPLCFRFDEALLSTNLHPEPVKLKVSSFAHTVAGSWTVLGSTDPKRRNYIDPPPLCFVPGKTAHVTIAPDLAALFPNRTMFNVRWPEGVPELIEKGVGNSVHVDLPIERDGLRQSLQVTLVARDSKARISTY